MTAEISSDSNKISVFISHRHVDKELADVFREEISDWCGDHADIYQSSSAQNASKIGTRLDVAISKAISESNLVLLIYTHAPGDYDWCMYECGLAQDPASLESNIAVFYTTEDLPDPMDNRVGVRLEKSSMEKFVHDFHRTKDFFARRHEPYNSEVPDEIIAQKSELLYTRLKQVAPSLSADVPVYDRITLGLSKDHVDAIVTAADKGGQTASFETALQVIPRHAIVRSSCGDPQEHFNYDVFEDGMPVGDLIERWNQDSGEGANDGWQTELCQAIAAAVLNRPERSIGTPFQSLSDAHWMLPLLARFRLIPYEETYEFDILFCKLHNDVAQRMLAN